MYQVAFSKCRNRSVNVVAFGPLQVITSYSAYTNSTTVRYINIQSYSKGPTCFGLFWSSSGRYLANRNKILTNYVTVM